MKRFMPVLISLMLCLFFLAPAGGEQHALRLLYVNDFHGFAEPYMPLGSERIQGGIAYLAGEVRRLRAEKPTLLLAVGDMIQGNNWANLFQGKSTIEVMNAMKFDAMVVGNHEFDFLAAGGDGYKAFGDAVRESKDFALVGGLMKGEKLVYSDAGKWLRDVVIEYIKDHKGIAPGVEGRIKEVY